jgi:two-component system chemotaxis response regulator CheB
MDDTLRILVVDDSALYRQLVRNVLREVPQVEVVGAAKCGTEALSQIEELKPDLISLDVQMPDINGIDVLRALKKARSKTRAIMLSSLTANGAQVTTDALLEGAFDFIHKPSGMDANANRKTLLHELAEKIAAFRASRGPASRRTTSISASSGTAELALPRKPTEDLESSIGEKSHVPYEAIVIGTSTGGPVALKEVLTAFPGDLPVPIFVVQHMPAQYTNSLAQRLNESSAIEIVEGVDGMVVDAGFAYIAPGGRQMKVERRGHKCIIRITDDPPENRCRPAVDYLFRSAAEVYHGRLVAVIMTGMGRDGAEGCREIKRLGGFVYTQHADGCTVYGMPKAVVEEKLSDRVVSLERIAAAVTQRVQRSRE